jgi:sugar lactone lactonase YvrE
LKTTPAWSIDGTTLYAGVRTDKRWNLWAFRAEGGAAPELLVANGYAAQAGPDGRSLYFTQADRSGLWRATLASSQIENVLDDVSAADWANWCIVRDSIFKVTTADRPVPVVEQVSLDGRTRRVVATLDQLTSPGMSVSPDGNQVFYARWDRRQSRIMLLESGR